MDSPENSFISRYLPLVREAAAVVAAILIAFSIDAWWDARNIEEDKLEALTSLEAELRENQELLRSATRSDQELIQAVHAILSIPPSEIDLITPDSATALISLFFQGVTFNPSEGALTSLLATGAFEEIDSRDLRQAIAGLSSLTADQEEEVDQVWVAWQRFVDRGIKTSTHTSFTSLYRGIGPQFLESSELLLFYLRDPEFPGILADFANIFSEYIQELSRIDAELERTISLIHAELRR